MDLCNSYFIANLVQLIPVWMAEKLLVNLDYVESLNA